MPPASQPTGGGTPNIMPCHPQSSTDLVLGQLQRRLRTRDVRLLEAVEPLRVREQVAQHRRVRLWCLIVCGSSGSVMAATTADQCAAAAIRMGTTATNNVHGWAK